MDLIIAGIIPLKTYKNYPYLIILNRNFIELEVFMICLINTYDSKKIKQYIGSSKDLYQILMDHLKGRDSNSRLQRSINKYGISNF